MAVVQVSANPPARLQPSTASVAAAVEGLWARFREAARVLRALPDREREWLKVRANWPGMLETFDDRVARLEGQGQAPTDGSAARGAVRIATRVRPSPPSAAAISRLEEVMVLYGRLEAGVQGLVWARACGRSWEAIARDAGVGRDQVRRRCDGALAGLLRTARRRGG